jgi:hypothetical protein
MMIGTAFGRVTGDSTIIFEQFKQNRLEIANRFGE